MFKKLMISSMLTVIFLFTLLPINALALGEKVSQVDTVHITAYSSKAVPSNVEAYINDWQANPSNYVTLYTSGLIDTTGKFVSSFYVIKNGSFSFKNSYGGFGITGVSYKDILYFTFSSCIDSSKSIVSVNYDIYNSSSSNIISGFSSYISSNSTQAYQSSIGDYYTDKISVKAYPTVYVPPVITTTTAPPPITTTTTAPPPVTTTTTAPPPVTTTTTAPPPVTTTTTTPPPPITTTAPIITTSSIFGTISLSSLVDSEGGLFGSIQSIITVCIVLMVLFLSVILLISIIKKCVK